MMFDNELNEQIAALHEAVKETLEYKQRQAIENLVVAFRELCEQIQPEIEKFLEAVSELWEQIKVIVSEVVSQIVLAYRILQRSYLSYKIKEKFPFLPYKMIAWIAKIYPDHWLPTPRFTT